MAEVWSAKRSAGGIEKFVAIKVLAPHLAEQQSYRDMFLAEARRSMMLHHRNIVHVIDAVDDPPDCYMVMELVEGMTLAQLERALGKQGMTIPVGVAAFVIGELLKALDYAHGISLDAGSILVHRDVSPQNVMVTAGGEAKLMDFGIARFASEETQGTFVKGKLQYMPPEQLRKETRKPTIDLFAVGAILHELIDGRRFRGNLDQARLIGMVIQGEVPALQPGIVVPHELEQLRLALLEPDEDHRIQTAAEALAMLERWPGYRTAAAELADLVQRYVKPAASTSGNFVGFEDSMVSAKPRDPTRQDSSVGHSPLRELSSDSELRRVDPRAAADTQQAGVESTDASLELVSSIQPAPGMPRPRPRAHAGLPRWFWAATAAMVVFASVGVFAAVELSKAKQAPEPATPTQPTPTEPTPIQPAEPTPSQPTPSQPTEPTPAQPTPTEPAPIEPAPIEPGPAKAPPPPETLGDTAGSEAVKQLVWVEFVANEFYFVYVRVNGKILTLEPKSRIKLPVGSFTVYLRPDEAAEWAKAGRITVEADKAYRVEMRKPAGLELVEVSE